MTAAHASGTQPSTPVQKDPLEVIRAELLEILDFNRQHVFDILDGLTEEQLHRPVLPSGWSPLGMVKHLALDDEHYWIRCIVGGESFDWYAGNGYDKDRNWDVADDESSAEVFALYRHEIEKSNEIIKATPLNQPPRQSEDWWSEPIADFSSILMHMIDETACHTGHLDAARELIDGRLWSAAD
jgi:Protein of unknown function (DUF664)